MTLPEATEPEKTDVEQEEIKEVEAKEEVNPPQKKFSEMTEDEKLALPEDELLKHLYGSEEVGEEKEEEQVIGKKEDVEKEKEEEKTPDEEFDRLEKLSKADFDKEPKEKKGLFYEMKKERARRQSLEHEIEKEREIRKAQLEVMEKMRGKTEANDTRTETQKVKAVIAEKAKKYEEEYGEEYRLSFKDVEALDEAREIDSKRNYAQQQAERSKQEQQNIISTVQKKVDIDIAAMEKQGVDDFDFVYKNFIEPMINPEIAHDKEEAQQLASIILRKSLKGENAMEYAYKYIAKMSPEGEKYFREKEQKNTNKKLAEEAEKKTTKTSSHIQTKATDGKTKVTLKMLNDDFEKWDKKLTEDQFKKVANGEDVYI